MKEISWVKKSIVNQLNFTAVKFSGLPVFPLFHPFKFRVREIKFSKFIKTAKFNGTQIKFIYSSHIISHVPSPNLNPFIYVKYLLGPLYSYFAWKLA